MPDATPTTTDATPDAVRRYGARVHLLSVYVRALLLGVPIYALLVAMATPVEVAGAFLTVVALAAPLALMALARAARPAGTAAPSASLWSRAPLVVFVLALLIDAFVFGRAVWYPPCPQGDAVWIAAGTIGKWGTVGAAGLLYLGTWAGAFRLRDRKRPDAARLALLSRIASFAAIQVAVFAWGAFIPGVIVEPAMGTADALISQSGGRVAEREEAYRQENGRYTDRLEALVPADAALRPDPGVTFVFSYAGDTRFTFTASHPKACEPQVFTQPNVARP